MKFILLMALLACSSLKETNGRMPASIFMNQYNKPGGKVALLKTIKTYIDVVDLMMKGNDAEAEWFKLCYQKPSPPYSNLKALECHDSFASIYFIDIDHENISAGLEKSDQRALKNNFFLYPSLVIDHYEKIALKLPD